MALVTLLAQVSPLVFLGQDDAFDDNGQLRAYAAQHAGDYPTAVVITIEPVADATAGEVAP